MNFEDFLIDFKRVQETHKNFAVVTFVHHRGSAPQETGTRMIVTSEGYFSGTVGGGKLEKAAIEKAMEYIRLQKSTSYFHEWNLQKDLGMSCGGTVSLFFETHNLQRNWNIVIFGAGHVAQELVRVLLRLECHLTCIDSRPEWLERLPADQKLQIKCLSQMQDYVPSLERDDFVVIVTMGHSTDLPIMAELLKSKQVPYLGVIGSDVKAIKLRKGLLELNLSEEKVNSFFCPMGEPIGNNTPAEISISIAAQLLRVRDEYFKKEVL
jgi:xanthine dehydrogenase accessory factor